MVGNSELGLHTYSLSIDSRELFEISYGLLISVSLVSEILGHVKIWK